jgi:Uncharacterised nucleotidyltransferase
MTVAPLSPLLLHLLRDPSAKPRPDDPSAHAAALLRTHVLGRLSRALTVRGLDALLVKGAALALTVYPAATRAMGDIDMLVRRGFRDSVVASLEYEGCVVHPAPHRPFSTDFLGETLLTMKAGAMSLVVEVHTTLDKLVPRPTDDDGIFARSLPAAGLPGLLIPAPEDHALLIALHAAGHEFHHPIALLDLELLLRQGLNLAQLVQRAQAWRLSTVMYILMARLRSLGAASVTEAHVRSFKPSLLRCAVVQHYYRPDALTTATDPSPLGLPWILRQAPLRDDLGRWIGGLFRYGAVRSVERLLFR